MSIFIWLRSLRLLAWFLLAMSATSAWAIKPTAPIRVTLTSERGLGDQHRLILRAMASVDSDVVDLSLNLPPDVVILGGQARWSGPLKNGEVKTLEATVQAPSRLLRQVVGKAIMTTPFGTFVRQSRLALDPSSTPRPPPLPSAQRRDHEGNIVEFKGR